MKNFFAVFMFVVSMIIASNTAFAALKDGLVGFYPFNGNANDESGRGNDGIVHEAKLTNDILGNANSAYNFDGVDDYIWVPHDSDFNWTDACSFSVWVKPNKGDGYIISKYVSGQEDKYVYLYQSK